MSNDEVVSLEWLRKKALGEVIELPPYEDGEDPIKVMAKRPNKADIMIVSDHDYTGLMRAVQQAFGDIEYEDQSDDELQQRLENESEEEAIKRMKGIKELLPYADDICARTLKSPTFKDFQNTVPLTVTQRLFIFNWVMTEGRDLRNFRTEQGQNVLPSSTGEGI